MQEIAVYVLLILALFFLVKKYIFPSKKKRKLQYRLRLPLKVNKKLIETNVRFSVFYDKFEDQ